MTIDVTDKESILDEMNRRELVWHKGSYCANSSCIEVARDGDRVLVHDTKVEGGLALELSFLDWKAFLAGARDGEFDSI